MDEKDTYLHELEIELYELSSKIDALKMYLSGQEDNNVDDEEVYSLEDKEEEIRQKLEVLKTVEEDLWEESKQDIDEAMEELREAVQNVFTI
ncbi:MAG: hypothetical protein ACE5HI_14560 [bacterium]